MKKSLYILGSIVGLIIMSVPLIVSAHHNGKGNMGIFSSSSSVSGSNNTGTCINFGYGPLVNSSYNLTVEQQQLQTLKNAGITCVRLAFYGTNSSVTKPLALLAKEDGFYVSIGNDGNPLAVGYSQGVIAEAQWAQANHIDQVSIGNEAAKNAATQSVLAQLSCSVRAVYSGSISYDTYLATSGFDDIKAWAQNKGCLTKLGLNIYANYAATLSEAKSLLGANGFYVSETDLDCDAGQCGNDSTWASGLQAVLNTERAYNVPIYVFSYDAGGDGVATHWAINVHPAVMKILGI